MLAQPRPICSDDQSDGDLLRAVAARDSRAFDTLFLRYYDRLRRFVWRFCAEEAVDEVISDTMYTVWRKSPGFRGESKVSTWICGIAYRTAMKTQTRRRRYQEVLTTASHLGDVAPSPSETQPDQKTFETAQWVEQALNALPRKQRDVVELTFFADLPYQEIAEIVGCPIGTVKTRMHKARQRLRPVLEALSHNRTEEYP